MPVMSPCGKIIENPEPTYEEKLECLLENDEPSYNYENVETNDELIERLSKDEEIDNSCSDTNQNYSNISHIQSLENYENFKSFFSEHCRTSDTNKKYNNPQDSIDNEKLESIKNPASNYCSKCGHSCNELHSTRDSTPKQLSIDNIETNNCNTTPSGTSIPASLLGAKCNSTSCLHEIKVDSASSQEQSSSFTLNSRDASFLHCSVSASNSPCLKRLSRPPTVEQTISSKMEQVHLRQRSNSADSSRFYLEEESVNEILSQKKANVLSTPSSSSSPQDTINCDIKQVVNFNKSELNLIPLIISELPNHQEQLSPNVSDKYSDLIGAKRSSSVPNKFFSNRDSSSSNDSGVSTGSLSLRHCGTDFLEFEMPLTTSNSSKRHHIAMMSNGVSHNSTEARHKISQKRSKSVDPLRTLTFTFENEEHLNGKSVSAEAEVPIFLQENTRKGKTTCIILLEIIIFNYSIYFV